MLIANLPSWVAKIFAQDAAGAQVRTVPLTTADPNAASFALGFPPNTFTDESAGGSPPDGRDFNGILRYLSACAQWLLAGGPTPYLASISANGGYPVGAVVLSAVTGGLFFQSTVDGNTTNPDAAGAGWLPLALRAATPTQLVDGTSTITVGTPKALRDAGFDVVLSSNGGVASSFRRWRSGYDECWGTVNIPANSTLVVNFPFEFTNTPWASAVPFVRSDTTDTQNGGIQMGTVSTTQFAITNGADFTCTYAWEARNV